MPASFQNNQIQNNRTSPKKSSSGPIVTVRLSVIKFEECSPIRIWFGVYHPHNTKLTQFYLSLPVDKRRYNDDIRNWTFDYSIYEYFVNNLQATEFDFIELIELPRFLAVGIRRYIDAISKNHQKYHDSQVLIDNQGKNTERVGGVVGVVGGRENGNGGENGGGIVIQNGNGRRENRNGNGNGRENRNGEGGGENGGGGQLMTQIKEEDSLNIETSLLDLLLPFQLEGIKFVVRHGGRALIGDDMVSAYLLSFFEVLEHQLFKRIR